MPRSKPLIDSKGEVRELTAAGEFGAQLVEQSGHLVIDILAAVIGMEAENHEPELRQHLFNHRQQMRLGDGLHRGHHLQKWPRKFEQRYKWKLWA